jgi:hypothetical protein
MGSGKRQVDSCCFAENLPPIDRSGLGAGELSYGHSGLSGMGQIALESAELGYAPSCSPP